MNEIKKYRCKIHNIVSTRKGIRKHLGEHHTRNEFAKIEEKIAIIDDKPTLQKGIWTREVFE